MTNKKIKENKTSSILVRIEPSSKKTYQLIAKQKGMTLSELIIARLRELPVDSIYDKELKTQLLLLKREMNAIGININQVTHALNIAKNHWLSADIELRLFNELLNIYNEKIAEMNSQFKTLLNF